MMKLLKAIVFAALVGSVAVIGCADEETNGTGGTGGGTGGTGGGTGGTGGGGGAEACTGGLCETADVKLDCEAAVAACNADAELDLTSDQCDALGDGIYCNPGTGGEGGTGGAPSVPGCDVLACETDADLKAACEEFVADCLVYCENTVECGEDECIAIGVAIICNVE